MTVNQTATLDWTRLLGFEQIVDRDVDPSAGLIGRKEGAKTISGEEQASDD